MSSESRYRRRQAPGGHLTSRGRTAEKLEELDLEPRALCLVPLFLSRIKQTKVNSILIIDSEFPLGLCTINLSFSLRKPVPQAPPAMFEESPWKPGVKACDSNLMLS